MNERGRERMGADRNGAGAAEERVAIWNRANGRKIAGSAAPFARNIDAYLAKHPECEVYRGQDKMPRMARPTRPILPSGQRPDENPLAPAQLLPQQQAPQNMVVQAHNNSTLTAGSAGGDATANEMQNQYAAANGLYPMISSGAMQADTLQQQHQEQFLRAQQHLHSHQPQQQQNQFANQQHQHHAQLHGQSTLSVGTVASGQLFSAFSTATASGSPPAANVASGFNFAIGGGGQGIAHQQVQQHNQPLQEQTSLAPPLFGGHNAQDQSSGMQQIQQQQQQRTSQQQQVSSSQQQFQHRLFEQQQLHQRLQNDTADRVEQNEMRGAVTGVGQAAAFRSPQQEKERGAASGSLPPPMASANSSRTQNTLPQMQQPQQDGARQQQVGGSLENPALRFPSFSEMLMYAGSNNFEGGVTSRDITMDFKDVNSYLGQSRDVSMDFSNLPVSFSTDSLGSKNVFSVGNLNAMMNDRTGGWGHSNIPRDSSLFDFPGEVGVVGGSSTNQQSVPLVTTSNGGDLNTISQAASQQRRCPTCNKLFAVFGAFDPCRCNSR